jgi:hypothetical protein
MISMNAKFVSAAAMAAAPSAAPAVQPANRADALIDAANRLLTDLERGVAIDARALRTAMIAYFGASDAEGAWDWKTAYEACARPHSSSSCANSAPPCANVQRRCRASSPC